jgi:hypothetical protein
MMTAPLDVSEGNQKRKKLLEMLARQAGLQQQGSARPVFGGGRPFFAAGNLPAAPLPQLTRPFPIPPGLERRLGPGAVGAPAPGEFSPAPGVPAMRPTPPGPPPVGAPTGGAPVGSPVDPTLSPQPTASLDTLRPVSGPSRHLVGHSPDQPVPTGDIMAGNLIPLGGGMFYNPATGQIHGDQIAGMGDALRVSQAIGRSVAA